jgi:hypothetical protein
VPYHSRHRSICNLLLALASPMLLRPRLPRGKWLTRSSTSCRHLVLVNNKTRRTTMVAMANGMAKHDGTTCPRSRSEPNSWAWSVASCATASKKSWTHISHSLVDALPTPWRTQMWVQVKDSGRRRSRDALPSSQHFEG